MTTTSRKGVSTIGEGVEARIELERVEKATISTAMERYPSRGSFEIHWCRNGLWCICCAVDYSSGCACEGNTRPRPGSRLARPALSKWTRDQ